MKYRVKTYTATFSDGYEERTYKVKVKVPIDSKPAFLYRVSKSTIEESKKWKFYP